MRERVRAMPPGSRLETPLTAGSTLCEGIQSQPSALPPGPTSPSFVQFTRSRLHPLKLFDECSRRFGGCFTLRFVGGYTFVLFSDPEHLRQIMNGDPAVYLGGKANEPVVPIVGPNSLVALDGERHLAQRRLILPAFHAERMSVYCEIIREVTDLAIERWKAGSQFRLLDEIQRIVLDVMVHAVFGVDRDAVQELRPQLRKIMSLADTPLAAWRLIPAFQGGAFGKGLREKNELLAQQVAIRRERGTKGRADILSMLIEARDDSGNALTDAELRDQMFTLLVAGYETTAAALAWALHRILTEPGVLENTLAELRKVVGASDLRAQQIGELEYLDAAIKESMRLDPVTPLAGGRKLGAPATVGRWQLPAGITVSGCVYLTHRRPDLWPDPLSYRPERFIGQRPKPYSFLPFGAGDRRCIGAAFATYEMKVVLAEILLRCKLRVAPGYRPRPRKRVLAVAPSQGMPVVLDRTPQKSVDE